jgi:hypothetical protein
MAVTPRADPPPAVIPSATSPANPPTIPPAIPPAFPVAARSAIQRLDSLLKDGDRATFRRLLGSAETDRIWKMCDGHPDLAGAVRYLTATPADSSALFFLTVSDRNTKAVLFSSEYSAVLVPVPGGLQARITQKQPY